MQLQDTTVVTVAVGTKAAVAAAAVTMNGTLAAALVVRSVSVCIRLNNLTVFCRCRLRI